jgi:glucosamine-6-phosphate deaminase
MNRAQLELQQYEKIETCVFETPDAAVREVAQRIVKLLRERQAAGLRVVLGLATGSTPVKLYRELIRLHREENVSFRNVITFNLDEYYGLSAQHPESYRRFMQEQLFDHVDIVPDNTHVPDGLVDRTRVFEYCREYEERIAEFGGIDIQILGIGRTGHIGFNEPGSSVDSRTRMVALDRLTRRDAARDFRGEANVPAYAITMGVGTILSARELILLAWGESKAAILRQAVEGPQTDAVPASFLQRHSGCRCYLDRTAAAELTRYRAPWKVGIVDWTVALTRQAVVWLADETKRPVLRLNDEDYSENGLAPLLVRMGSAYSLNIRIFNELQQTITGWPGGKPNADDSRRPVPAEPAHKRVLVLSPEPLDAELGMGGTLNRLVSQGHEVTLTYLTSGNLGVPDAEARMATSFLQELAKENELPKVDLTQELSRQLNSKGPFDEDSRELRRFKGLIRKSEAYASAQILGLGSGSIQFLDLPFYERGRYRQFRTGKEDIEEIVTLCERLEPHQIYVTGSRSEPGSVSGIAFQLVTTALEQCPKKGWLATCQIWLYATGERPWLPHESDMTVPLSPAELGLKIDCLYHHRSQRSQTPLSDAQTREVWQQAEHTNRSTAKHYDRLGLAEYEAIETFRLFR